VPKKRLVFMDESGSNTAMTRLRGRAPKGKRLIGKVPRNRGTVTTMLGALRHDGVAAIMTTEGATTGAVFSAFAQRVLAPKLKPGDVVVLDNLKAHKAKEARDAIYEAGARMIFLPPYHPELNPIEEGWSKLKNCLRSSEARTIRALDRAIAKGCEDITSEDARGWFRHSGYHVNR